MSLPHPSASEVFVADNSTQKDNQIDDLFGTAARAAGLSVPVHLKTKTRRWVVLILVGLSCSLCAGPISSWPTLEPILIREHVFEGPGQKENLSEVFSVSAGLFMITALLNGMFYDVFGPRWVGVVGSLGCAVSLLCMALAVNVRSMNWLLWISYPASTFFGGMNSNAVYAWYWLLPEYQNSVSSVSGCIQILSDSFVLMAVWLHNDFDFSMSSYFLLVGGMSCVAGFIAFWLIPTFDENAANSAAVIEYRLLATSSASPVYSQEQISASQDSYPVGDEGEAVADRSKTPSTKESAFGKFLSNVKDTFRWWVRLYPTVNVLFNLYMLLYYMWTTYPQLKMLELYTGLLGPEAANRLVDVWGGVFPVVGVIFVLCFGTFVDMVGYRETIALLIAPTIILACLYPLHSFDAQVVAQVILSCVSNTWNVTSPRFALHYAPPELFGTIYGVQGTIMGVGQTIGTPVATWVTRALEQSFNVKGSDGSTYLIATYFWCALHVGSVIPLLLYWWYKPPPAVGSCSMEDIRTVICSADASQSHTGESEEGRRNA